MVVKPLNQPSNIQNIYKQHFSKFEIIIKNKINYCEISKIDFDNFELNRTNRSFWHFFGIYIFLFVFWNFHIFHCLVSHARGHYCLEVSPTALGPIFSLIKLAGNSCTTSERVEFLSSYIMAPRRHQGTIAPRALKHFFFLEKGLKANLSFEGVLRALVAYEYAGIIGNGYSFAHAKYGANP